MAGTNPDPAESVNVLDVIREFTRALDAQPEKLYDAQKRALVESASSPTFEVRQFGLTVGAPVLLLGFDLQRARALLRANTTDVFVGSLGQLQSGFGYPLPTAAGDEFKTTDEVYVVYNPSGAADPAPRVAAWIERNN